MSRKQSTTSYRDVDYKDKPFVSTVKAGIRPKFSALITKFLKSEQVYSIYDRLSQHLLHFTIWIHSKN